MSFHVVTGHLYVFLWEMSIQTFCLYWNYVVFFVVELWNILCILDRTSMSDMQIFSSILWGIFLLNPLHISYKILVSPVCFVNCDFCIVFKKLLPNPRWHSTFPSYVALVITYSLWCVLSLFLYMVGDDSPALLFCICMPSFVQYYLKETVLSPIDLSWYFCQKSIDHKHKGFFLWIISLFHWSMSVLMPIPQSVECCKLYMALGWMLKQILKVPTDKTMNKSYSL
jgi:hypothetical protein